MHTYTIDSAIGQLTVTGTLNDGFWDNVELIQCDRFKSLPCHDQLAELLSCAVLEVDVTRLDVVLEKEGDCAASWTWADNVVGDVLVQVSFKVTVEKQE